METEGGFRELIQALVSAGADPNDLVVEFEKAVLETGEWVFWGTEAWRRNLVCSKCGSESGGLCHDVEASGELPLGRPFSGDERYHKNQPRVTRIPYREWKAQHPQQKQEVG